MITLITGGARSGKTRHALVYAGSKDPKTYIATSERLDDEMRERAARHRAERGLHGRRMREGYNLSHTCESWEGVVDDVVRLVGRSIGFRWPEAEAGKGL